MNNNSNGQRRAEVVLIDHTGARHRGEDYDAMQALREAEAARPKVPEDIPWIDWNGIMRERERG